MTNLVQAAQALSDADQKIITEVSKADPNRVRQPATQVPVPGGTTYEQAKRSEHTGTSGEKAYGAPLDDPIVDQAIKENVQELRRRQHSDNNN